MSGNVFKKIKLLYPENLHSIPRPYIFTNNNKRKFTQMIDRSADVRHGDRNRDRKIVLRQSFNASIISVLQKKKKKLTGDSGEKVFIVV